MSAETVASREASRWYRKPAAVFTLLVGLALGGAGAARTGSPPEPRPDLPATIPPLDLLAPGELPVWVSREAAVDERGEVRWDLFLGDFPDQLRRRAEALARSPGGRPEDQCTTTVASGDFEEHEGSLDEVVDHALAILRGRVVARAEGFAGDLPANLLAVAVDERIQDSSSLSSGSELYVIYPRGRFTFGGIPLCDGLAGFPPVPAVGDRIVLLPHREPVDRERRVLFPSDEEAFLEGPGGVTASGDLSDRDEIRELPDLDALESLIRAKIAGDPAGRPFDRRACTPAALDRTDPYEGLGPYDRTWVDRHWSVDCTQILVVDLKLEGPPGIAGPEHAVSFDVDGDGAPDTTSWPYPGQALPWLDLDHDGVVDGGQELFGVHTRMPDGSRGPTALEALAAYDRPALGGDGDGAITARDLVWRSLRLWVDLDHDGRSRPEEIFRPEDVCLASLSLEAEHKGTPDGNGNWLWSTSRLVRRDARGKPLVGRMLEVSPLREVP